LERATRIELAFSAWEPESGFLQLLDSVNRGRTRVWRFVSRPFGHKPT
jgi:hypothetical protein